MIQWRVKICGITNANDAVAAGKFGADAIGMNFYPRSLRCLTPDEALSIIAVIPPAVSRIGVFVNASIAEINETVDRLQLQVVQLHGDESPDCVDRIQSPVLRAIRVVNDEFETAADEIRLWLAAGVEGILLDAGSNDQYGGTGKSLSWESVSKLELPIPLVLAGGLNCGNVAEAIQTARPAAVDVASGVESFPGRKDHQQLKQFIENAMRAFATL